MYKPSKSKRRYGVNRHRKITYKKSAYNTKHKAFWKGIRGDIGASYHAPKERRDRYPFVSAVYKTIGRRMKRNAKNNVNKNFLRSEL